MSHKSHSWADPSRPPEIRPHSAEKHRLLEDYLFLYIHTLTQNVVIDRLPITLVDGFAGGNVYVKEGTADRVVGSPSLLIETIRNAEAAVNETRIKKLRIIDDYFFIEKDPDAFDSLRRSLAGLDKAGEVRGSIEVINDDFDACAGRVLDFIKAKSKSGRSIFVLDQCGYDKVPFHRIRDILGSIPNAEIILTFAADFLIDYLCDDRRRLSSIPELDLAAMAANLDKGDPRWRRLIQLELHAEVQKHSTARFYTPFFIRSKDSHRDLWLVHLSRHHRARDVMMGVHWKRQNCFAHYGPAGFKMLGYDPDEDVLNTGRPFFPGFYFDDKARALTVETLLEELPGFIYDFPGAIDFKGLFSSISNVTPATSEILKASLMELAKDRQIVVKDATGLTSRKRGVQHDTDVISIPRQKLLFFGSARE